MDTIYTPYVGALMGVVLHHGLFIHGEWHVQAPHILMFHLVCFLTLVVNVPTGWQIIGVYLLGLFSSILTYRLFFHRLNDFPGPRWARASKIWHLWTARTSQNHFFLAKLRDHEITVFHPDIFMAVDGPRSKCSKGEWYDLLHPDRSLVNARTSDIHRPRRRVWMQGFTSKALVGREDQTLSLIDQMDQCIQDDMAAGRSSNVTDLIYWLSFDRMAQFVLGRTFNMLTHPDWRFTVRTLKKALSILGPLSPTPWLVQIVLRLVPRVWILKDWFGMMALTEGELRKIQVPTDMSQAPALGCYLMESSQKDQTQEKWLAGDSLLAFVAGSDPTAGILHGLFYELARSPDQADLIYRELQQLQEPSDVNAVRRCKHLEAAIFESLRLYPSLPTGGNRKTPPTEGITVAGVYIPPDTTVVAPRFCISRREDCYVEPNKFIPERWTTRPEMVLDRSAFVPFGTAFRSCLGRGLAMNDMMLVAAHVIQHYRMSFPAGGTGDGVFEDWKDQFTSSLGRLQLRFERRTD
ncbi:cytochrome P450 [Aspergillus sclerotiicarbonarius CBS 121057]|uniref:Cytochrome P450 n=1 Tax=Aspergillus sclerotiicarbonarius (strain CBS 121057 / IBT 28362) TaxID=1448318 RepID=A0A319EK38_ASPSB|nr:cytochrome P450 [Aspergillus sclerotiicarbonarius CBS 121057]